MPRQLPDHNGLKVLECAVQLRPCESTHADEIALYQYATKRETALPTVADAFDIYRSEEFRHSLNALLITNASDDEISPVLEIPLSVLRSYRHLFF